MKKTIWVNRIVLGFALTSLFSDMGHEMVTSLTPGFLVLLGAPPIALGLIEGISSLAQSAMNLLGGIEADRVANRKPHLFIGYLATAFKALYFFAYSWPWLVVIRTLGWMGRGWRGPMRDTLMTETVDRSEYGAAFGFREAMDTVGALSGPLIGALLLGVFGYRTMFALSAIPGVLSVLVIAFLIRDHRAKQQGMNQKPSATKPVAALPPAFWRLLVTNGFFSIGNVAPSFFILAVIAKLSTHNVDPIAASTIGMFLYTWHNAVYALTAVVAGKQADRMGPRNILLIGYSLLVIAMVGFALMPPNILILSVLFTLTGLSAGMQESVQKTYVSLTLPERGRGRGLGIHAGVLGMGQLVSGVLIGGLWSLGHYPISFMIAGLMVAVSILLLILMVPKVSHLDIHQC